MGVTTHPTNALPRRINNQDAVVVSCARLQRLNQKDAKAASR